MNPEATWASQSFTTTMLSSMDNTTSEWFTNITISDIDTRLLSTVSPDKGITMTLVYGLIFVTGIVGNVCTCVVIARNKDMHTATNFYLFSLAISDLMLLVLGLPHEMYHLWVPEVPYTFGEKFCVFRGLAAETSTNASILTITAFTVERYVAICHPLRSHTMSKLSRAIRFILVIWVMATLCAVPQAIQMGIVLMKVSNHYDLNLEQCHIKSPLRHSFELSTIFFFFLPLVLITVLYILIGLRLRNPEFRTPNSSIRSGNGFQDSFRWNGNGSLHKTRSGHQETTNAASSSELKFLKFNCDCRFALKNNRGGNSRRAVVKMLVAVVVAFFVCWAPFHAQRLMAIYASTQQPSVISVYEVLTYISGVLYYVSATVNPILYHIMSLKFRSAFKETLGSCCRRRTTIRTRQSSSFYSFNSTMRSRMLADNTEVTLDTNMREEDPDDKCGTDPTSSKRISPPYHNGSRRKATTSPTGVGSRSLRCSLTSGDRKTRGPNSTTTVVTTNSPINGRPVLNTGSYPVTLPKSDSISNSSMQMMEDEVSNPMELVHLMGEVNERYDVRNDIKTAPSVRGTTPSHENGSQNNGYFLSRC